MSPILLYCYSLVLIVASAPVAWSGYARSSSPDQCLALALLFAGAALVHLAGRNTGRLS